MRDSELVTAASLLLGADARPLDGGYSGETFLVGTSEEEAVLRLYIRRPDRAPIDAALHRLVRGLIPVPQILDSKLMAGPEAPAYLLTERLPGVRLDLLLEDPDSGFSVRQKAGEGVGRILALLSGMPFLEAGEFTGPDLAVRSFGVGGLEQWVQAHRERGHLAEWSGVDLARLLTVAVDAQALLDTGERVCLCHSDLNPKNLLADPDTGEITALLDWEFAFAGAPHTDIGNLLRFETDEAFCRSVVRTYAMRAPSVGPDFLDRARASDLYALIDLAGRDQPTKITRMADGLLHSIASAGDLGGGRPNWLA